VKEVAKELEFKIAAPEGAVDDVTFAYALKAYPDTNREFFSEL
jgi:hypothetical protein